MGRRLAALAALPLLLLVGSAHADPSPPDPIGDLLISALTGSRLRWHKLDRSGTAANAMTT